MILKVKFIAYEDDSIHNVTIKGKDLYDAIHKMVDKMQLNVYSDQMDDDLEAGELTRDEIAENVIKNIIDYNGESYDFITLFKNETTDEVYIYSSQELDDEIW